MSSLRLHGGIGQYDEAFRPHMATWRSGTNHTVNPHLVPMQGLTCTLSNYGRTYSTATHSSQITALNLLPDGRRYLRFQSQNHLMTNADDRCDGSGTLSVSPKWSSTQTTPTKWFSGGTGGDAVQNGYSGFRLTNAIAGLQAYGAAQAVIFAAGGATVNHIALDSEINPDEFNLTTNWKTALQADSFWPTMKAELDALVLADPSTANTSFTVADWTSQAYAINAWHSWYKGRIALVPNALLQGFRTQFPNCSASDDGYHGRSAAVVYAAGVGGGGSSYQGQLYYEDSGIVGDYTSEESYGEMGQAGDQFIVFRSRALLAGDRNPYHTLRWEISRLMATVMSGRLLKPWVNFFGASRSDFQLGGYGRAAETDTCPYMVAHLAASALMSGVAKLVSTGYSPAFPQAYYSDTISDGDLSLSNGGVDQGNKLFWDNADRTIDFFRAGQTTQFKITASTGNNGTYTIDYSNGGIWYDSGADRTYMAVNEAIPSAVSDGTIEADATDAMDTIAEAVLADLDAHIGSKGPRQVLQRATYFDEVNTADAEIVPTGSSITWAGLRHGSEVTYCIVIGRTATDKTTWTTQAITGYVNGVSIGTIGTMAANKAYLYYTRAYVANAVVTFSWAQTMPTNLLATQDITDTGTWTHDLSGVGGPVIASSSVYLSPITNGNSVVVSRASTIASFAVSAGKLYTVSCYIWIGNAASALPRQIEVQKGSDSTVIGGNTGTNRTTSVASGSDRWERYYITFVAPHGETTCKLKLGLTNASYGSYYCHPMAVQGILPGPIA